MTAAIFGLLGVVVGGVLNGAIASRQAARQQSNQVRASARLLAARLLESWDEARDTYANGHWSPEPMDAPSRAWVEDEELFAASLRQPDWEALRHAVNELAILERLRPPESEHVHVPTDDAAKGQLQRTLEASIEARPVLSRLEVVGTRPTLRERRRRRPPDS